MVKTKSSAQRETGLSNEECDENLLRVSACRFKSGYSDQFLIKGIHLHYILKYVMEVYMLCSHGCGREGLFFRHNSHPPYDIIWRCAKSSNQCPALIKKNSDGLKRAYAEGRRVPHLIHCAAGWSAGTHRRPMEEIFCKESKASNGLVRSIILEESLATPGCYGCGIETWLDVPISLDLHHINGDNKDNTLENLCLLCPNCHSQTENFRGRNIAGGKYRLKVSDTDLISAILESKNTREALLRVNLAAKGANYERVKKLRIERNLKFLNLRE